MKKMKKAAVAAVILAALIIAGILFFRSRNSLIYDSSLYFLNGAGTSLSLETRSIKYHNIDELPEKLAEELISGPVNTENIRIVSKKTRLLSVSDDDNGNYTLDFSEEFSSEGDTKTVMSIYSVVKSLCSLSEVQSVRVIINGEPYKTSEGNEIGALTAEDINLATDTYSSETMEVIVYFADSASKKLTAEKRNIRITDQRPIEQYVIEELIKGPEESGHSAVLSKETNLISVTVSNNIGFVDFDKSFIDKNVSVPENDEITIFSVVNSMTELDGVNRVQFLVNGKRAEKFGSIDISDPISRNSDIIEK